MSEDKAAVEKLHASYGRMKDELAQVIVGQHEVVEQVLMAMFCRGHALLVGVPGLAKTLLVSTVSQALDLQYKRIQFTPDLMPADITGTDVLEVNPETGHRGFRFVNGPLFASMVLADEINRTPPKTQAALLEAMQEGHVTVGDRTLDLPDPFFVLATQNPIEQEGTYPLPEAQKDRFMLKISMDCPARDERGFTSWITTLADGHDRALSAIAAEVDPHWRVSPDGRDKWIVGWSDEPLDELDEVAVTKFSTGVTHVFIR